jgi:muramoyltetrapeptide carboxypeptidase
MPLTMPRLLKEGDRIALVGPASPMKAPEEVEGCIRFVESLGLQVKEYPSARLKEDYLAGTDKQRAADINKALRDEKIKAILAIRGGYGSSRLLPLIDWKAAAKSRKLFAGFSDITSLIGGFAAQAGLATLHAPTPSYFLRDVPGTAEALAGLRRFLFQPWKKISYRELCGPAFDPQVIRKGKAKGVLVGGNISVFVGLLGTPYQPKAKRMVLFIEDIGEKPYKVDRYVTHLINAGFFKRVSGVMIGQFDDCNPVDPDKRSAVEVLSDCLRPLKIPVLAGLPIGHGRPSFPLPMGADVELDANNGDVKIG